jgi:hypothetical protein
MPENTTRTESMRSDGAYLARGGDERRFVDDVPTTQSTATSNAQKQVGSDFAKTSAPTEDLGPSVVEALGF